MGQSSSKKEKDLIIGSASNSSASHPNAAIIQGKKNTVPVPYQGHFDPLATACNDFGKKLLLLRIKQNPLESVVISSVSIEVALAMTGEGTVGTTRKEIFSTLGIDLEGEQLERAYKEFVARIFTEDDGIDVIIANSIWAKDSIEKSYKEMTRSVFGADVYELTSPDPINKWCAEKTRGKIEHVVTEVSPHTNLLLANAIYFKGEWTSVFDRSATQQLPFYVADSTAKMVDTMHKYEMMWYYEDESVQVLDLPYKSNNWFARIVLPKKSLAQKDKIALDVLVEDPEFDLTRYELHWREGQLKLPRFTVRFGPESINDDLKALGMNAPFEFSSDFSKMSSKELCISNVIHAAVMEVNEEGTVAAAVTVVECESEEEEDSTEAPFNMTVDRPFLFSIVYRKPRTSLFLAAVYDITQ